MNFSHYISLLGTSPYKLETYFFDDENLYPNGYKLNHISILDRIMIGYTMFDPNRAWGTVRQLKDRFRVSRTTIYKMANKIGEALCTV